MHRKHTLKEFDRVVDRLMSTITEMGQGALEQITRIKGLLGGVDGGAVSRIMEEEERIDLFQEEVDRQSVMILSAFQPVAVDLRCIIASLKIGSDLERVADYAVNITKQVEKNGRIEDPSLHASLTEMADIVIDMLRDIIIAYRERDVEKAFCVYKRDDRLDAIYKEFLKRIGKVAANEAEAMTFLTAIVTISKYFERAGDHIKNIAEHVQYMVTGETSFEGDVPCD